MLSRFHTDLFCVHCKEKCLVSSVCYVVPLFKRKKSNTILLSGLGGSGKTVLFYQVIAAILLFCDDTITVSINGSILMHVGFTAISFNLYIFKWLMLALTFVYDVFGGFLNFEY